MTIITAQSSPHPLKRVRRRSTSVLGMTLVELLITMSLMGVIMAGIMSAYFFITKSSMSVGNYAEMSGDSRLTLQIFARDVRMATDVKAFTSKSVDLEVSYSDTDIRDVDYAYDVDTGILTRTVDSTDVFTLLTDVSELEFEFYNLLGNETTNVLEIKRIHFSAKLLKKVMHISNTNQVISAGYMMRNRKVSN